MAPLYKNLHCISISLLFPLPTQKQPLVAEVNPLHLSEGWCPQLYTPLHPCDWSRDSLLFPQSRLFIIFKRHSELLSWLSRWTKDNPNKFEISALTSRSLQGIHYFIFTVGFKHWVLSLKGTLGFCFYQEPSRQVPVLKYKTNII